MSPAERLNRRVLGLRRLALLLPMPPRMEKTQLTDRGAPDSSSWTGSASWAIVTAGGRATRDRVRARSTLDALARNIAPERTVLVSSGDDAYISVLGRTSARPIHVVPLRDARGTALDVLLPVYWIHYQDPGAVLSVFLDHAVPEDSGSMNHLSEAFDFVRRYPRWILLLGAAPARAAATSGWIVPAEVLDLSESGPVWRVRRLHRSCAAPVAGTALASAGAFVATAATLVKRTRILLPALHEILTRFAPLGWAGTESDAVQEACRLEPRRDFARALLDPSEPSLAVLKLSGQTAERKTS